MDSASIGYVHGGDPRLSLHSAPLSDQYHTDHHKSYIIRKARSSIMERLKESAYETYIPRKFVLDGGKVISLTAIEIENELIKEPLFLSHVPPQKIDDLYNYLKDEIVFEDAIPSLPKGEKYGIRKKIGYPWEVHLRLYSDGSIMSEVEVQREYIEHLGEKRLFIIYEPFDFYKGFYDKLHIFYKPEKKWVVNIIDNFRVKLTPPKSLTPWKPVITGVATLTVIGLLAYALGKLSKG